MQKVQTSISPSQSQENISVEFVGSGGGLVTVCLKREDDAESTIERAKEIMARILERDEWVKPEERPAMWKAYPAQVRACDNKLKTMRRTA